MKWHNHKLVTTAAIYAATGGVIPTMCSMSGAILPDVLEMGVLPHRTVTHWPYPYLVVLAIAWAANRFMAASIWPYAVFFVLIGAVMHLLEDSLSISGIPFGKTPTSRYFGLGVYATQGPSEEVTVLGLVTVFIGLAWVRGFVSPEYFGNQVRHFVCLIKYIIEGKV